jgi:hypothetical protein
MKVKDEFRKNSLSLTSGGSTVYIKYLDGKSFEYDKVKNPHAYCKSLLKKSTKKITEIRIDGVPIKL